MSGQLARLNLHSTVYTEGVDFTSVKTFARNQKRGYFFIVMTSGTGTISFGEGTGEVPLALNQFYEPYVCPTSEIRVTTTGTFVVVSNIN
ncbi:MAG: hypothetical protein KUG64_10175 [Cycloclasticus sp.]|nr:hypothetical protein [Cycloclasticus sp.]